MTKANGAAMTAEKAKKPRAARETKTVNEAGEPLGKRRLFCEFYITDCNMNASKAIIKAGYSTNVAAKHASEFMADPVCKAYIAKLMAARSERIQIDADYVLRELTAIQQLDLIDIFNDDMSLKPLNKWPPTWRKCLSGLEVVDLFEGSGDTKAVMGSLKKIKWPDKLKTLELMGRHVGVGAFRDQIVIEDASSLAEKLAAARKRVTKSKE